MSDINHGTIAGYNGGKCRCEPCRKSWSEYQKAGRLRKKSTPPDQWPHGTLNGYTQYGCRCEDCKPLGPKAMRDHRAAIKGREDTAHGTLAGYSNYGCRCNPCSAVRSAYKLGWDYLKRYNLTLNDYEQMWTEQGGACAICNRKPHKLAVDHNHDTGEVRGLICRQCNSGLGMLQDSPEVLRLAREYLLDKGFTGRLE